MRGIASLAALALTFGCLSAPARAQQPEPPVVWPDPPGVQRPAPPPAAAPAPTRQNAKPKPAARPRAAARAKPASAKSADSKPAGAVQAIGCEGPFARDSNDARVAEAFGRDNVVFSIVDGAEGTKLNATVVFPKDSKRRLEILWHDPVGRTRPASIVLSPGSGWSGPKGVRVGQTVTEVQRRNGRPFRLMGFGADTGGAVADWQGGAFDKLPGACRLSVRFEPEPDTPPAVHSRIDGTAELLSTDAALHAAKLKVVEMFLTYPQ